MDVKKFIEITVRHEILDRYCSDEQCQAALDEIINALPESDEHAADIITCPYHSDWLDNEPKSKDEFDLIVDDDVAEVRIYWKKSTGNPPETDREITKRMIEEYRKAYKKEFGYDVEGDIDHALLRVEHWLKGRE